MSVQVKTPGKVVIILLVLGAIFAGKTLWWDRLPKNAKAATTVGYVTLPDAPEASLSGSSATVLPIPSSSISANGGSKIVWKIMAWNAQFALMYANGGAKTTKDSLMDKGKVSVEIVRQDDCNKTCADIVKFAQDYKKNTGTPAMFATLMGDGMPAFFAGLVKELEPLGPDYRPIAFYPMGKSYGEDQVMGPKDWKTDPKNALGKCVAGVLRDGDVNILLKWAGDNGLPVNPDETTYDENAINLIAANDFLDAPNKYITGYREKRKKIVNGKKIADTIEVGVDAVATWTPGDVNVAKQKGGLVTIASTKQYSTQMAAVTITIKKWATDHRTDVENIIVALAQAGDQVRSYVDAKKFAAKVSANVYAEQNAQYWLTYYTGITEKDMTGQKVSLGGSMVFNLRDAANMFGLGEDGIDRYKIVYTTFGDIMAKMYPEIMATYPAYSVIVDKSFLQNVISSHTELLEGKAMKINYAAQITEQTSSKSYSIQFVSGSAQIQSVSYGMLEEILRSAVIAEGLKVSIGGNTDSIGDADANQSLSESRAESVKKYLVTKGLSANRIEAHGYGASSPVADNDTSEGRAKNRRCDIVLGQ